MTIITKNEYSRGDFYQLYDNSWSGALQTLDDIKDANKEEEFMDFLEGYFEEEVEDVAVNDFIWFEREYIYENLGLNENGELEEEEED